MLGAEVLGAEVKFAAGVVEGNAYMKFAEMSFA